MKPDIINRAFTRVFLTPLFQIIWYYFFPVFIFIFSELILVLWYAFTGQANPYLNYQHSIFLLVFWAIIWTLLQQISMFFISVLKVVEKFLGRLFKYFSLFFVSIVLFIHPFLFLLNNLFLDKSNPHFWVLVVWNSLFTFIGSAIFILWFRKFPIDSWRAQLFSSFLAEIFIQFFLITKFTEKVEINNFNSGSFIQYSFYWLCILIFHFLFVQSIYRPNEKESFFSLYRPFLKKNFIILTISILFGIFIFIFHLSQAFNFLHHLKQWSSAFQFLVSYLAIQALWFQISSKNLRLKNKFISFSSNPEKFAIYIFFLFTIFLILVFIQFTLTEIPIL